jgi:hypothetical protein
LEWNIWKKNIQIHTWISDISLSIHLYFNIHRTYYLFFKLHEIINKSVLAINVCYYSCFFQRYKYVDFFNEFKKSGIRWSQTYRSPTLSTDTPCPEAKRRVTTANVTPKTTNSNSLLPNTASNEQKRINFR